MSFEEVHAVLKAKENEERAEWERVRQQCFYSVIGFTTKISSPQDLFSFPWDAKDKKQVSKASKSEIKEKAKKIEKWLDKKTST